MHLFHHQFKNVLVLSAVCFMFKMIWNVYSVVAAMQLMEYAPNSPSIQKRFGTAILHGNKMFPSLEYDWMQIVHTPPCLCQQFVDIWKRFGNLCHNEMIIIHQFHHFWQFFINTFNLHVVISYLMGIETSFYSHIARI